MATLVDTSVWVRFLRGTADHALLSEFDGLLAASEAAWCPMVRLELWAGERDGRQRQQLTMLDGTIPSLAIDEPVWIEAVRLTQQARAGGVAAPPNDFLIFACARVHGVALLHRDKHFDLLARL